MNIRNTIQKYKYRHRYKIWEIEEKLDSLKYKLIVGGLGVSMMCFSLIVGLALDETKNKEKNTKNTIEAIILECADINKDLFISKDERRNLYLNIAKENNIYFMENLDFKYKTGEIISQDTIKNWIQKQKQSR